MAVTQDLRAYPSDEDVSIRDLIADIRRSRLMVASMVAILTLGGIAYGLMAKPKYEASTVLAPVTEGTESGRLGGLSSLASQYGGLASLAGLNLRGGGAKDEDIAVLQSELLTDDFVSQNNLLPILFSKLWDPLSHAWKTTDPRKVPTLWKANRMFETSIRKISDDQKTGLIRLSIRWHDPALAAQWANGLAALANSYLRQKAIQEAERNIAFLDAQLAKTNVVEVQSAIASLLEEEINKEMLAKGRNEYALKVIDPAFAPERPSSPGPIMLGFLGFVSGWLLAVFIVFGRRILRA